VFFIKKLPLSKPQKNRQEKQKGLLDFFATLNQGKSGAGYLRL